MSNSTANNQRKLQSISDREWNVRALLSLACLLLLMICGGEAVWIMAQREHRAVDQAIIAGTTRQEIEQKFGEPRWVSRPRQPLSEAGWNGIAKETISESGLYVYNASIFAFIICEFDEDGKLKKAIISGK